MLNINWVAAEIVKELQEVFGTIIRWPLLVYNIHTKNSELEDIEHYIASVESERNNTIHSIEHKKSLLLRNSEKVVETAKKYDKLSQILLLVFCFIHKMKIEKIKKNPHNLKKNIKLLVENKENMKNGNIR